MSYKTTLRAAEAIQRSRDQCLRRISTAKRALRNGHGHGQHPRQVRRHFTRPEFTPERLRNRAGLAPTTVVIERAERVWVFDVEVTREEIDWALDRIRKVLIERHRTIRFTGCRTLGFEGCGF